MESDLLSLIDRFAGPHIVVVGDYMLDEYLFGSAERISPEAPVPVLRARRNEMRPGGAGAVAAMIAALGGKPHPVGIIGTDANGVRLAELLATAGVPTDGLIRVDRPTTHKLRIVGLAHQRHPQQIVRVDTEDASPVGPEIERQAVEVLRRLVPLAAVVCLQDYAKGVLTPSLCRSAIDAAAAAGRKVLVDPARISDYSKYRGCSCLTPNRNEAMMASGLPDVNGPNAAKAAQSILTTCNSEAVLVTLDKEGAYLLERGGAGRMVPTRPRTVYDNAGAGDMVLATMASALAAGADYGSAARLANLGGGLEVERFGVQPIALSELRAAAGPESPVLRKVRTVAALLPELAARRGRGESVVFTNGCFDLVHPGHVAYLNTVRRLGDVLVVGLNSDRSVRELKGDGRPIYTQDQRTQMLTALEAVDYVVVFDQSTPLELIRAVRPNVLAKGDDYKREDVVGHDVVESYGGRVAVVRREGGLSTTALVERLTIARAGGTSDGKKGA